MIDFSKLIDPEYLFEKIPPFPFKFLLLLLSFFGLMFISSILIPFILKRKHKKVPLYQNLAGKIQVSLIIFSLIGFLLLFFRWQGIPYLSARILLLLLFLSFVFWLVFFLNYLQKDFKKQLSRYQAELRKLKYLPLPKKELQKWLKKKQ